MKKHNRQIILIMATIGLLQPTFVFADNDDNTQVGRYLTVNSKPLPWQMDLLSQQILIRFPQNIQTIGDAMNYTLRLSGYSLVPHDRMSNALKTTLNKPLPAVDRNFGPMTLKDGLTTLAGPSFYMVQDPLNRMVDFRVKSQYAGLYIDSTQTSSSK